MAPSKEPEKLGLTFGLEIEAALAFAEGRYSNLHDDDEKGVLQVVLDVIRALAAAGIEANLESQDWGYQTWSIVEDGTIQLPEPDNGVEYHAVEIVSRILNTSSLKLAHSEIDRVLRALEKSFSPVKMGPSCGLHIHVGANEVFLAEDSRLKVVNNVALLLTGFEHVITQIPPDHRIDGRAVYCVPASHIRIATGTTLRQQLTTLVQATDVQEVVNTLQPNPIARYAQTNYMNMVSKNGLGTIEFRFLPATLDTLEIMGYVELVTGLVSYAHSVTQTELLDLLREAVNPNFTFFELIAILGRPHLGETFRKRWKPRSVVL